MTTNELTYIQHRRVQQKQFLSESTIEEVLMSFYISSGTLASPS